MQHSLLIWRNILEIHPWRAYYLTVAISNFKHYGETDKLEAAEQLAYVEKLGPRHLYAMRPCTRGSGIIRHVLTAYCELRMLIPTRICNMAGSPTKRFRFHKSFPTYFSQDTKKIRSSTSVNLFQHEITHYDRIRESRVPNRWRAISWSRRMPPTAWLSTAKTSATLFLST